MSSYARLSAERRRRPGDARMVGNGLTDCLRRGQRQVRCRRKCSIPLTPPFGTELSESWAIAPDGMSVTFKLRRDARFHDGTPVTARDVKWSFDRAVTVGGFPTFQMKAGSLEKPEQFEVVDDFTFRAKFLRKDKMTMPDLAVVVPAVFNAELAKKHATANDPWAMEWLKSNDAGSGAFRLESWKPGQETIYTRFDEWKPGPLPKLKRVIVREVPSAGNRRALLERGDADISFDLPPAFSTG